MISSDLYMSFVCNVVLITARPEAASSVRSKHAGFRYTEDAFFHEQYGGSRFIRNVGTHTHIKLQTIVTSISTRISTIMTTDVSVVV